MTLHEPDHYIQSAEMYDMLSEPHWAARRSSVKAALAGLSDTRGIVLDVGAGTGRCVQVIAEAMPEARIHAVEPSASMRVGLMTRILLDPDLRRRVTVFSESFQQSLLTEKIAAAVICGCIGYFDADERAELWRKVAYQLEPGGFVLADVMSIDRPQHIAEMRIASVDVGEQRYDTWLQGRPGSDDIIHWTMRFDVLHVDTVVRTFSIEREWRAFGLDQLIDEAAAAGFIAERLPDSPVPAAVFRLRPNA